MSAHRRTGTRRPGQSRTSRTKRATSTSARSSGSSSSSPASRWRSTSRCGACSGASQWYERKNEPSVTPLRARRRRGQPFPQPRLQTDAVDGSQEVPRRAAQPPARLRLGGREARRRAHPDREGEGAAPAAGHSGASRAGRRAGRHQHRRDRRIERRTDAARRAAPTSPAPPAPAVASPDAAPCGARNAARRPGKPGRRPSDRGRGTGGLRVAAALSLAALASARRARARAVRGRPAAAEAGRTRSPSVLKQVGIDQKIGQQLPLDLTFKDEDGREVRLGQFFSGAAGGARPRVLRVPDAVHAGAERHDGRR